jgi:putative oxidoreductase
MLKLYDRLIAAISSPWPESLMLLFVRVVFAGIFWRSGLAKMAEGSWFTISDGTWELFRTEYSGVPLPPELAAPLVAGAEHLFPVLLVAGLFMRVSALALLVMTMTIQIFVYPDAWWTEHSLWTALALVLIVRGGGNLAIDKLLTRRREA